MAAAVVATQKPDAPHLHATQEDDLSTITVETTTPAAEDKDEDAADDAEDDTSRSPAHSSRSSSPIELSSDGEIADVA